MKCIKQLVLLFLCFSFLISQEKIIKKIFAENTEYDRKNNLINFYGNVKIELKNGYITCENSTYYKKIETVKCKDNVYTFIKSTNSIIEVRSSYAEYDAVYEKAIYTGSPYIVYTSSDKKMEVYSDKILFDEPQNIIFCEGKITISAEEGKFFCKTIKYILDKELFLVNYDLIEGIIPSELHFVSSKRNFKLNWCKAKYGTLDLKNNILELYGNVEMEF